MIGLRGEGGFGKPLIGHPSMGERSCVLITASRSTKRRHARIRTRRARRATVHACSLCPYAKRWSRGSSGGKKRKRKRATRAVHLAFAVQGTTEEETLYRRRTQHGQRGSWTRHFKHGTCRGLGCACASPLDGIAKQRQSGSRRQPGPPSGPRKRPVALRMGRGMDMGDMEARTEQALSYEDVSL